MPTRPKTGLLMFFSGASDTTRPTVTITCAQTSPTATSPLNMTFTFSEDVSGFELGDITAGNGTAGNFATTSASVYTCDVTPTATGAVTVDVAEGVAQDAAGNTNTAATQFSITAIVYALNDLFTTDDAAPLTSPRTAEPGPGTLVATDTGNRQGIVSGQLKHILTVGRGWGDPGIWGAAVARAAGMAFLSHFNISTVNTISGMIGWDTNQASTLDDEALHIENLGLLNARVGGVSVLLAHTYAATTDCTLEVILRSTGFFIIINDELAYVDASRTTATVYPGIVTGDAGTATWVYNHMRAAQLPAPWNTDNGIATQVLAGARSTNDAFVHEANCIITFTATTKPSAGDAEVRFRIQDATNYWAFRWNSDGGGRIFEVVDSVATQRGGAPTDGLANGGKVQIICRDATIKLVYVDKVQANYTSATSFQTETDGMVGGLGTGGALSNVVAWPMTLSGTAKAVLDAANP
jgi:hypothetical protein